jgi:hypothetical protein
MGLFPDDFPFGSSKRATDELAAPVSVVAPVTPEPIVEATTEPHVDPPLIAPPAAPAVKPAVERRKALRHQLITRAQLRADVGFTGLVSVEVHNISFLGVRLISPHPIDVQQKAQIRLEVGPLKWSTRLRVVTCQHDEGSNRFHLGCQFIGNEMMKPWGGSAPATNAASAAAA